MTGPELDRRLTKALTLGDRWRSRSDGLLWTIRTIHRKDGMVIMTRRGRMRWVWVGDLRRSWLWHVPKERTVRS